MFHNGYNGKKPRRAGENLVCYFCQRRNNVSFVQHTKHHLGAVPKLLKMNSTLCNRQTSLTKNGECSLCVSEFKISSRQYCFVAFFLFPVNSLSNFPLSADWKFFVSTLVSFLQFHNRRFSITSCFSPWALKRKHYVLLFIQCFFPRFVLRTWYCKY